jgi:hypothetical protein
MEDMRKVKIIKRKGTIICDGADLQKACVSGSAIVIRGDGEVADPATVANLTNTLFDIPSVIMELTKKEFNKCVKPKPRQLRSNHFKTARK